MTWHARNKRQGLCHHNHTTVQLTAMKRCAPSTPTQQQQQQQSKRRNPAPNRHPVGLNSADCNLDFNVEKDGLAGSSLHENGFGYCWSGARANLGIDGGKYCFSCKIISKQPVETPDVEPTQQHVCRVGVSRGDDDVGSLGESCHSFGYGGTGKFSTAGRFSNYGDQFTVGDTILCAIDLDSKPLAKIGFAKNGKWLGIATEFDAGLEMRVHSARQNLPWAAAVFPHVLLKNVIVELQFDLADGLVPLEGYKPWAMADEDRHGVWGPALLKKTDCEVLMMIGLPASGKTTWAEKHRREHLEKRYIILGTNIALEQMKVPGLRRKRNYEERFELLMDRATTIFNKLLERAAVTPRNYILDQTNVYKSARKRKLRPFDMFYKIAVVVFPSPSVLKDRTAKRIEEMGKEVPADAVNEMRVNFVLPLPKNVARSDEPFDEVWFIELQREEAEELLRRDKHDRSLTTSQNCMQAPTADRNPERFMHPLLPLQDEDVYRAYQHGCIWESVASISPMQRVPSLPRPGSSLDNYASALPIACTPYMRSSAGPLPDAYPPRFGFGLVNSGYPSGNLIESVDFGHRASAPLYSGNNLGGYESHVAMHPSSYPPRSNSNYSQNDSMQYLRPQHCAFSMFQSPLLPHPKWPNRH